MTYLAKYTNSNIYQLQDQLVNYSHASVYVVGSITSGFNLSHTINKWSKLEPLTTWGSQAVHNSRTTLSGTIFHKKATESLQIC